MHCYRSWSFWDSWTACSSLYYLWFDLMLLILCSVRNRLAHFTLHQRCRQQMRFMTLAFSCLLEARTEKHGQFFWENRNRLALVCTEWTRQRECFLSFLYRIATKDFNLRWVMCSQTSQSTLKQTWSSCLVHSVQNLSLRLQEHSPRNFFYRCPEAETCCCKIHRTNWRIVKEHIMAGQEHETSALMRNHNIKHQQIRQ